METVRLNADVDVEAATRLRHVLLDERITFAEWLRRQIDEYVEKKEPKGKRRKGKGGVRDEKRRRQVGQTPQGRFAGGSVA